MKFLIYLAVIFLVHFPVAHTSYTQKKLLPTAQWGYVSPRSKTTLFPNYYLFVNIGRQEVTELLIKFPSGLHLTRGINVISNNQVIDDVSYTVDFDRIAIKFDQPISQKELKIVLKGIKYFNNLSPAKLFYLSANVQNNSKLFPLGTIMIKIN